MSRRYKLLLSDVDGTLVTPDKTLTPATLEAVSALKEAGVRFAITSARSPQGLKAFVEPLHLSTPIGAFNGATMILPDQRVIQEHLLPDELALDTLEVFGDFALAPWVYRGTHWYVSDDSSEHVRHESHSCLCEPERVSTLAPVTASVSKIVGVSDDEVASADAARELHERFGHRVSVSRSQSYFLDVTHPEANKGNVVRFLAKHYDVATHEIATIGDMHNDVSMFQVSGLSIAMGNALADVQSAANFVTSSNDDEGFARAVTEYLLD